MVASGPLVETPGEKYGQTETCVHSLMGWTCRYLTHQLSGVGECRDICLMAGFNSLKDITFPQNEASNSTSRDSILPIPALEVM